MVDDDKDLVDLVDQNAIRLCIGQRHMSVLVKVVESVRRFDKLVAVCESTEEVVHARCSLFVAIQAVWLTLKLDHPACSTLANANVS
jgi:hypothetical protein